jgi:hypothetical protein
MFAGDAFDLRIRNRSVRFAVKMYSVRLHNNEAPQTIIPTSGNPENIGKCWTNLARGTEGRLKDIGALCFAKYAPCQG